MRLSAKAIVNYCDINDYETGNQWIIRSGELNTLYFQLVDLDQAGLRHLVGVACDHTVPYGVQVIFPSLDDSKMITATAQQVSIHDRSIWKVSISAIQTPNSGNVQFAVTECGNTRRFNVLNLLSVEFPQNDGSC